MTNTGSSNTEWDKSRVDNPAPAALGRLRSRSVAGGRSLAGGRRHRDARLLRIRRVGSGGQQQREHRRCRAGEGQPTLFGLGQAAGQGQADAVPVAPVGPPGEQRALEVPHAGSLVGDVDRTAPEASRTARVTVPRPWMVALSTSTRSTWRTAAVDARA